jgi:hypothetical protein
MSVYDFTLPSWHIIACMVRTRVHVRAFRVGGLRFVRIGRLQLSWCIVRNRT